MSHFLYVLLCFVACCTATVASARQCYQAETVIVFEPGVDDKGVFPADNYTMVQCNSTDAFCFKQRLVEINDKNFPNFTDIIHYRWGCSENEKPLKGYIKCGDDFIESYMYTTHVLDVYQNFVTDSICSCCGDFCNNSTMDGRCDSDADPDKNCFSSHNPSDDPKVDESMLMSCTKEQSCYVRMP